jgi:two-component system chemotaxis response regulator CheB
VLIVDDSVVARAVIGRMIDATKRFAVVGSVSNAQAALAFLRTNQVAVILLDIEMPGVDGLTALPDMLAAGRGAKILVVSSSCDDGAVATIKALALGAADTLVKPGVGSFAGRFAEVLAERLDRLIEASSESGQRPPVAPRRPSVPAQFDIVAIGASTGGIHALSQLLRAIPPEFQVPILVTQHLPASFMPYFAAQLAVLGNRPCDVASDCMRIRPGRMIVAPGGAHIRVVKMSDGAAIRLSEEPATSGCMPSVDPMFDSIADVFGSRALGIVLSGMGKDGSEGARKLAAAGGSIVVQDQASSVVWGMPGTIASEGGASAILPPDEIGRMIASQRRPQ